MIASEPKSTKQIADELGLNARITQRDLNEILVYNRAKKEGCGAWIKGSLTQMMRVK